MEGAPLDRHHIQDTGVVSGIKNGAEVQQN